MKFKILSTVAAAAMFAGVVLAQHDHQAVEPATSQMKSDGMMGHHQQVEELVNKLVEGFAAIQNEADPAVLAKKLAEHGTLLKELQAKVKEGGMMEMPAQMKHQMKQKMQEKMKAK